MTDETIESNPPRRWRFRMLVACMLVGVFLAGWFVTGTRKDTPSPKAADAPKAARSFLTRVSEGRLQEARQMLDPSWTDAALGTGLQSLRRDIAGKRLRKRSSDYTDAIALGVIKGMGYAVPSDLRIFPFSAGSTPTSVVEEPSGGRWRVWAFSYGSQHWGVHYGP